MRQVWISKAGPPSVLEVRHARDAAPGEREVRIRVHAAGVNFADLMARMGLYPGATIPGVVGYEVSGTIDAVGPGSTVSIGTRVMGVARAGGYADAIVLPETSVFPMPAGMTFEEAAAIPVAYLTAHHAMFFTGNLRARSRILVHSAAGGVGLAALDLAKTRHCEVIGIAARSKHDFLRARGCQHTLDSGRDYRGEVRRITGGRGVDLVLDPIGGKSLRESYAVLAPVGRLVAFGFSAVLPGKTRNLLRVAKELLGVRTFGPGELMNDNRTVTGISLGRLFDEVELMREQIEAVLAMYERGEIKPHVDRTFALEDAAAAHDYIHERRAKGKVLLLADGAGA